MFCCIVVKAVLGLVSQLLLVSSQPVMIRIIIIFDTGQQGVVVVVVVVVGSHTCSVNVTCRLWSTARRLQDCDRLLFLLSLLQSWAVGSSGSPGHCGVMLPAFVTSRVCTLYQVTGSGSWSSENHFDIFIFLILDDIIVMTQVLDICILNDRRNSFTRCPCSLPNPLTSNLQPT